MIKSCRSQLKRNGRRFFLLFVFFWYATLLAAPTDFNSVIASWKQKTLELLAPQDYEENLSSISEPNARLVESMRLMTLVAQLDWILPAQLINAGFIPDENPEVTASSLDSLRAEFIRHLKKTELEFLLERYGRYGLQTDFRGKILPPTNLIAMIRERLHLGSCSEILEFKPTEK